MTARGTKFLFAINFLVFVQNVMISGSNVNINGEFHEIYNKLVGAEKLFANSVKKVTNMASNTENDLLCFKQIEAIETALERNETWALMWIDSWGKFPSGIFMLNTASLGQFDQCLAIREKSNSEVVGTIQGKYCLASIGVELNLFSPKNQQIAPRFMPSYDSETIFRLGICVPDVCSVQTLNEFIKRELENLNITVKTDPFDDIYCSSAEKPPFTVADWTAIIIFSIIGVIMLTSTIYDLLISYRREIPKPLFIAFSITTNVSKLLKIQTKKSEDVMECLHGIRCLSIIWVVFAHSYMMNQYLPIQNGVVVTEWIKNYFAMFIIEATISVDSFLLISGLLVTWNVFKELDRRGSLNIPLMYFHRYLRLTPVLAGSILLCVSLIKYFGSGPLWNAFMVPATAPCEKYWWSALLYIQNYLNPYQICIGHSWYLSVDTQLFIISPLILIPLWKWGRRFLWVIPLIILGSISNTFAQVMIHKYSIQLKDYNNEEKMEATYYPTHARMGPWLIGVLLGYYLYINKGKRINLSKHAVILGWIASLMVLLGVLLGPHNVQQFGASITTLESAFYEAFSRVSWSIALAWIIFACVKGYGGLINDFLSHPLWQPISKLQYSIYIYHLIVFIVVAGTTRTSINFSDFNTILQFWSYFAVILCISVVVVLAFESPIIGIEKVLFKKQIANQPTASAPPLSSITESRQELCDRESGSYRKRDDVNYA